jgi:type I restriction-modification system DNA methylase subunit
MSLLKKDKKREYGDFQTPLELSELMINILKEKNIIPDIIIEPTCGIGNILFSSYNAFSPKKAIGVEINANYFNQVLMNIKENQKIKILNKDIFNVMDIIKTETNKYDTCLFIGNPPWVTNSDLSAVNSTNIPIKENINGLRGIDAITGKSNFDITEYIILKLIDECHLDNSIYAFLCKTSVQVIWISVCFHFIFNIFLELEFEI